MSQYFCLIHVASETQNCSLELTSVPARDSPSLPLAAQRPLAALLLLPCSVTIGPAVPSRIAPFLPHHDRLEVIDGTGDGAAMARSIQQGVIASRHPLPLLSSLANHHEGYRQA